MSLRLVRASSNVPNLTGADDAKSIRYAYGGVNGVVKDFGEELTAEVSGRTVTLKSGRVVVDGWEVDVLDQESITLPSSSYNSFVVYIEVNLTKQDATLHYSTASQITPPAGLVPTGDDLTKYPTGLARYVLYTGRYYSGSDYITVTPAFKILEYATTTVSGFSDRVLALEEFTEAAETAINNVFDEISTLERDLKNSVFYRHIIHLAVNHTFTRSAIFASCVIVLKSAVALTLDTFVSLPFIKNREAYYPFTGGDLIGGYALTDQFVFVFGPTSSSSDSVIEQAVAFTDIQFADSVSAIGSAY